jgi:hypothetical protein
LPNLKKLSLIDVNLPGQSLEIILKKAPNIEEIDISSCKIQDLNFQGLGKLPNLYKLEYSLSSIINGEALASIIYNSSKLQDNTGLLLFCLKKFSEYHCATGFIIELIIKQIHGVFPYVIETICASKC